MLVEQTQTSGDGAMGVAARRKGFRSTERFQNGCRVDRAAGHNHLPADKTFGRSPPCLQNFAGRPDTADRREQDAITPLCDANPTPNLLVNDGATVLFATQDCGTAKAMPSALCNRLRQIENLAARGGSPEGSQCDGAACTGFGFVARSQAKIPRSTPRQTAAIKSLRNFPGFFGGGECTPGSP